MSAALARVTVGGELLWRLPGEDCPRVSDRQLADKFGVKREDVRRAIREHRAELSAVAVVEEVSGRTDKTPESLAKGGRPSAEYYLTLEQALLLAMHLRSPRAMQARIDLAKLGAAAARGEIAVTGPLSFVAMRLISEKARKYERLFDEELLTELRRLGGWDAVPASCYRSIYDLLIGSGVMGELRALGVSGKRIGPRHHQHFKEDTVAVVEPELDRIKSMARNCTGIAQFQWLLGCFYGSQRLLPGVR